MRREKTQLLHKRETAIGKSFTGKSRKYFSPHQKKILRKQTLRTTEANVPRCSVKQEEIFKIYKNTAQVPAQVFSCEFCEIYKNTYFVENLQNAAFSIFLLKHNNVKKQSSNYKISKTTTRGIL